MKALLIMLAATTAFGSGVLGAAWAQSLPAGDGVADKKRVVEASTDKPAEKSADRKAPVRKEGAAKKASVKKEKDDAERAPRIDPDAPVMAASDATYKCVDADGSTTYRNVGDVRGCKKLEAVAPNTVPFPRPASAPSAARAPGKAESSGAQRARDTDRRRILQEELASEEKKLADLRKEYNGGEPERRGDEKNYARYQERTDKLKADLARSESNIDSLRREISAIRD